MKLLARILSFVPCRTTRAVDSAFNDGFIAGAYSAGIIRDRRGRFKSLVPQAKQRPHLSSASQLFPPSSDV